MSTWWRTCRYCGAPGTDVRLCQVCGGLLPYASSRTPDTDWRLLAGCLVLGAVLLVAVVGLGLLAIGLAGR